MKRAEVWKDAALARVYLDGVRGAIPLAGEQIAVMLQLLKALDVEIGSFLDLGCGGGALARAILDQHPGAEGVLLDFSQPMLQEARNSFASQPYRLHFVQGDYGDPAWVDLVRERAPFDAVVSGFSIHHQDDGRKRELYREILSLLRPGGIFVNIEHVTPDSPWVSARFENLFIDNLHELHRQQFPQLTRQQVADQYYHRPDKEANLLAPLEDQCRWLREIGYQDVGCYFKIFELAVFGGRRL